MLAAAAPDQSRLIGLLSVKPLLVEKTKKRKSAAEAERRHVAERPPPVGSERKRRLQLNVADATGFCSLTMSIRQRRRILRGRSMAMERPGIVGSRIIGLTYFRGKRLGLLAQNAAWLTLPCAQPNVSFPAVR
jgi:hypothetical protein